MNLSNLFTNGAAVRLKTGSSHCKALLSLSLGLFALSPSVAQDAPQPQERAISVNAPIGEQRLQLPTAVIPALKMVRIPHAGKSVTKKAVRPKMITLPDGSRARVSDMHRRFAAEESQLNQHGFSLFEPNQPILDLEPDLDYGLLERQRQELVQRENVQEAPEGGDRQFHIASGGVGYLNSAWSWSAGDKNYFQVSLADYLHVFSMAGYSGNPYLSSSAEGIAGGAILGNSFALADAYVSASSSNGNVGGSFTFQVLGNYIINWNTTQSATWTWNWSAQQEVAEYYQVWIGPIPVNGRVGIRGSIGCSLNLGLYGASISATTTPNANLSGFAEVGVGTSFAGAGVGGQLTFLQCNFPVKAGSYLQWPNGQPQLVVYVNSQLNIDTLNGKFYIWADLFGWSGQWTLWNWNGIHWNGTVTNQSQTINL